MCGQQFMYVSMSINRRLMLTCILTYKRFYFSITDVGIIISLQLFISDIPATGKPYEVDDLYMVPVE